VTKAEQFTKMITGNLAGIKTGSLRSWGNWFGKPYDNIHRIVSCQAVGDILQFRFEDDELLSVLFPEGLEANNSTFLISDAAQVRWEWFYYGRPKVVENRYFLELTKREGRITTQTNWDWNKPDFKSDVHLPAVEVLSYFDKKNTN
jgi:hypothetical protein